MKRQSINFFLPRCSSLPFSSFYKCTILFACFFLFHPIAMSCTFPHHHVQEESLMQRPTEGLVGNRDIQKLDMMEENISSVLSCCLVLWSWFSSACGPFDARYALDRNVCVGVHIGDDLSLWKALRSSSGCMNDLQSLLTDCSIGAQRQAWEEARISTPQFGNKSCTFYC